MEVRNTHDLIEVVNDSIEYTRTREYMMIAEMIKDPNFSVSDFKEYKPDLWNWVQRRTKEFWERRGIK